MSEHFLLESEASGVEAPKHYRGDNLPLVVSYGGGTNSTAMLCGMRERGMVPKFVAFADTGAEMPHTYEHVAAMSAVVRQWWGIDLITTAAPKTIVQHCENTNMLPSLAYGRRSCSQKFKHEPLEKSLKAWAKQNGIGSVLKAIGYDAEEGYRQKGKPESKQVSKGLVEFYWYPLIEWGWRREECVAAIQRHGLPQPGKSACFFCPASRKSEVFKLGKQYPDLMKKALKIEEAAQVRHRSKIGLGGHGNLWSEWLSADAAQQKLWLDIEPHHTPCGCYDGG